MSHLSKATVRFLSVVGLSTAIGCAGDVSLPDEGLSGAEAGNSTAWGVGAQRAPLGVSGKPVIDTATGPVIGDELLVRFAPGLSEAEQQAAVGTAGGLVTYRAPRVGYAVVRFAGIAAAEAAYGKLAADARITNVAWNHIMEGSGIGTAPTLELGLQQWNLYAMQVDPFHPRQTVDGVVIAILDTGAAYEDYSDALGDYRLAPDLEGVTFGLGYDFINDDGHPNDDQRHGTHVTGVIAAARGIEALAEGATIIPIKVLDNINSGTELALAEGLVFAADEGAQVANMSLSFPPTYFPSHMLQTAVDYASQKGVIMVAAAGNHDEGLVAYPAAFRDVIAVGASDLPESFTVEACGGGHGHGHGCECDGHALWGSTIQHLRRAPYSNHGYKIDLLAPGGTIPGDADGDGNPEAVLAQTFATGDPTSFNYYFYAGTSQATAEISAIAARMLFENPDLDAYSVRAVLGEKAKRAKGTGKALLTQDFGRGLVDAGKAVDYADHPHADDPRPRFFADVIITLHNVPGGVRARATVEMLDDASTPVRGMTVYGMWSGAAFAQVAGVTNSAGIVTFDSDILAGNYVVAFQVDAVTKTKHGKPVFDRPRGFVRMDSESLDLLTSFGSGIGTAPTGIGTAPTGAAGSDSPWFGSGPFGSGIGTAPTIPLPSDPGYAPLVIAFDPALFGADYRPTLLLPNMSWGLATAPMAVAVDEAWFLAAFPGAENRRVLSFGKGVGASAFLFYETSFPTPPEATVDGDRIALILLTFTSGIGTAPTGIGTAPTGIGTAPTVGIWVDRTYGSLGDVLADDYQILIGDWYAYVAGIGTAPTISSRAWHMDEAAFSRLSELVSDHITFSNADVSKPVAWYNTTLAVASMPMAPVAPAPDGAGLGSAAYDAP